MTHRQREKQAKRIDKARKRQCRIIGCKPESTGFGHHSLNCREFSYRIAMAEVLADLLSPEEASRYGA
jgi:hypothetical protein